MTRLYNKEIESGWGCGEKFIFECLEDGELMGIGLGLGVGIGFGDEKGCGYNWRHRFAENVSLGGEICEQTLGVEVCGQDAGYGYDAGYENGGDIHPYHESNFDARIPKPPK